MPRNDEIAFWFCSLFCRFPTCGTLIKIIDSISRLWPWPGWPPWRDAVSSFFFLFFFLTIFFVIRKWRDFTRPFRPITSSFWFYWWASDKVYERVIFFLWIFCLVLSPFFFFFFNYILCHSRILLDFSTGSLFFLILLVSKWQSLRTSLFFLYEFFVLFTINRLFLDNLKQSVHQSSCVQIYSNQRGFYLVKFFYLIINYFFIFHSEITLIKIS